MRPFGLSICLVALSFAAPGRTEQLRILTSMPPSFYQPFVASFSKRFPDTEIVTLNKNTNASVDELLRGNDRRFDLFWSSSPEAFELLRERGLLAQSPDTGKPEIHPFAYSALGWTFRQAGANTGLAGWDTLLLPENAGKIAMARPSRSGSAHMVLERFLQVRGWQDGWAYLLEMGGNLSTVSARSFTVLDGVANGRFELGLTIDFLAHSRRQDNLGFVYGTPVMVTPARIAILADGRAPEAAAKFVGFVISDDGQRLLLSPDIARTPHSARIRAEATARHHRVLEDALMLTWLEYNAALASRRYWAVNALFDAFIFEVFDTRRAAWRRLRQLERSRDLPNSGMIEVRRLLTTMPVAEDEVGNEGSATNSNAFSALSDRQEASLREWRTASSELLDLAEALLDQLEAESPTAGADRNE